MCLLGLGKLGASEMSYGSDLDLIFIYSGEGATSSPTKSITNSEFFTRVAQRLIRTLTSGTFRGKLYSVDTRLRPSGSQGTLVVSLAAFIAYHERSARPWERQVLLRARPIAGDEQLGAQVASWIDAFLFVAKPPLGRQVEQEIVRLRLRLEKEIAAETNDFYNFKLGRGGLLDIEFIAQRLQLEYGAALPELRGKSTRGVLEAAREAELLDGATATTLLDAYAFLRRLEGRMRIVRGVATERLPREARALEVEARRMGYRQHGAVAAGEQLLDAYRVHTGRTRQIFQQLFSRGHEVSEHGPR
jgi:glutamate-ammonia-ligase adenylyltransferase